MAVPPGPDVRWRAALAVVLEDLGFCPKGVGGRFVSDGRIAPGGALPVNTNGGGLSYCHPGMYGLLAMVEAARQVRGEAANRIGGVDLALAHGNGGTLSSQATVILGSVAPIWSAHGMKKPPLMSSTVPVTNPAPCDTRYSTPAAMSAASPNRPTGIWGR